MNERLCLVEDDPTIRELVAEKLRQDGFQVSAYDDAEAVFEGDQTGGTKDLYIIDILLSGHRTGLDLCRDLRSRWATVPILILSALAEAQDRIEGLRVGADDYLTKPFEMEELILRVRGMLRRRQWYGKLPKYGSIFAWSNCQINFISFEGRCGMRVFQLTQKECMLMKLLVEREGDVVSRDDILNHVWGYNVFPSSRTVDNFIVRIRRHFEEDPKCPRFLHSIRGAGYKFSSGAVHEA